MKLNKPNGIQAKDTQRVQDLNVNNENPIPDELKEILKQLRGVKSLEDAVAKQSNGENYTLITNILRSLNIGGFSQGLIPISNATGEGIVNLEVALSRILNLGEEIED